MYEKTGTFAVRRQGRRALEAIRPGDTIFVYLSGARVLAGMFEALGEAFEDATPLVRGKHYPHRLRVRPLVTLAEEDRVPYTVFHDRLDVVRDYSDFRAVVQQVIHPLPRVDEKVLEFLIRSRRAADFDKIRSVLDAYREARAETEAPPATAREPAARYEPPASFDRAEALEALLTHVEAQGFVYEPWEVAAYVTALRTRPFVILAGVTGTGKSRLPALAAAATGGRSRLVPVHPDWTDGAEVIGYEDLQGHFRPGALLRAARAAAADPARHHVCIVDEMNLARVEHYFADVLSRIEDRRPAPSGGFVTDPLWDRELSGADAAWGTVGLPPNLGLVGTVNMDESAHGFSRKVLDRAFTLELADVDLDVRPVVPDTPPLPSAWPVGAWFPRALMLATLPALDREEQAVVARVVRELVAANVFLAPAQLPVAYRTRDEVALFVLHAAETAGAFRTRGGTPVDPLDLAVHMKVLPRVQGGSRVLRYTVRGLLGWAVTGDGFRDDEDARVVLDAWDAAGRPNALPDARFSRTAARLCLMWERLLSEGFTSFWL